MAIVALAAIASPSQAVEIGEPIASPHARGGGDIATYAVSPLRVADPDGGAPWGVATFRGEPLTIKRRSIARGCVEVGRVVDGRLGALTAAGVFRPFEPMRGLFTYCGALDERAPGFAIGNALQLQPARLPSTPCMLPPAPRNFTGPVCDAAAQRTIVVAGLGRGILGASITPARSGRSVAVSPEGLLLAIMPGFFTEATEPVLQIRATVCGPDARTDLRGRYAGQARGCTLTFAIPDNRPAPETAASKRARRARSVNARVKMVERRGTASLRRFTARLTVPITVRSSSEGYAYRLSGPGGRGCDRRQTADTTGDKISSFLMVAGRTYDFPVLPFDTARGGWCAGDYRLELYFVERASSSRIKRVATIRFHVTRQSAARPR